MQRLTHKRVADKMAGATRVAATGCTLEGVSVVPPTLEEGETITFFCRFDNATESDVDVSVIWSLGGKSVVDADGTVPAGANDHHLKATVSYQDVLDHVDRAGDYELSVTAIVGPDFTQQSTTGETVTVAEQASGGGSQDPDPSSVTLTGVDRSARTVMPGDTVDLHAYYTNTSDRDASVSTYFYLDDTQVEMATGSSPANTQDFNVGSSISYEALKAAVGSTGYYRLSATAKYANFEKTDELTDGQIRLYEGQDDSGDTGNDNSDDSDHTGLPELPGPTISIAGVAVPVLALAVGGATSLLFLALIAG